MEEYGTCECTGPHDAFENFVGDKDVVPEAVGSVGHEGQWYIGHVLQTFELWPTLEDQDLAFGVERYGLAWYEDRMVGGAHSPASKKPEAL